MRLLLASAGLGALAATLTAPAMAETVISTATTTPLTTSASGDIHVSSTGSVKPTSGAAIVTINSSNYVKNEGALTIQGVDNTAGILANTGLTGDITNSGNITVNDKDYTPADTDNDGIPDGPFALGSNRFGIHVLSGGTYTGNISNSGSITVGGNQSAGIAIDSALQGSLTSNGKVNVLGDDVAGIRTGSVSGNVTIGSGSAVGAAGKNAVGVLLGGDIGGAVVFQGSVTSTGYRYTTPPADTSKLDADDLLQGGSAIVIAGNVANGVLLDARPTISTTNPDVDNDGIPDAQETTASVTTFGAAPAIAIGSATQDISIGAVASSSAGFVNKGAVAGVGVYNGVSATGILIGGTGHNVSITGGIANSGSINVSANAASATALHLGAGATVPAIVNDGVIGASGGGAAGSTAQAILIDSGASVNSITNSSAISATLSGTGGSAAAIVDNSGTLGLIQNSGSIGVTNAADIGDAATAIDLRANSAGAVVRQVAAASGKPAPQITGTILFGSGSDTLDVQAGSVVGKVDFGGGADVLNLTGGSLFRGTLANSNGVAVTLGGGSTFDVLTVGAVNLGSLNAGAGSVLGVTFGQSANTVYNVTGNASFGAGSKILVTLNRLGITDGNYTIVDAGTVTGADNLSVGNVPFLFDTSVSSDAAAGTVSLDLRRKGASELGLNASETAIFGAALTAADSDQGIAGTFLSATDSQTIKDTLQQLLPDHAGGAFETATKGSRLTAQILSDPRPLSGLWLEQVAWGSTKSIGSTSSYDLTGWGATVGYDIPIGNFASVGLTGSYLWGKDGVRSNELISSHYEGGAYIRGGSGPFHAWARATIGTINFESHRNFSSTVDGATVSRTATGNWKGTLYSGTAGLSYEVRTGRLSIRPNASVEYYKLNEGGYAETGGGDAMDLTVRNRNSDEAAANALVSVGYDFLGLDPDSSWLRLELEGGRRQILSGSLGNTVASFGSGTPFTLTAEERTSGWRGGVRVLGGGPTTSFTVEANAEQQQGDVSIGARASIIFAF
jgi:Autotransporter beta-domain